MMEKLNKITYFFNIKGYINTLTFHGIEDDMMMPWIRLEHSFVNDAIGYIVSDEETNLIYCYRLNVLEAPDGFDFNAMFKLFEELNE